MTINKKGFTLIEMLVVVLIIGILAAVALPQYQLAVDKAEFAKFQSMAASIRDAYDEYVLLYGEGTANFNNLSISLPDDFTRVYGTAADNIQCFQNSEMFCCLSKSTSFNSGLINCGKNNLSFIYVQSFWGLNNTPGRRNPRCMAEVNNARANRLCNSLGKEASIFNTWTPEGVENSYQNYILN